MTKYLFVIALICFSTTAVAQTDSKSNIKIIEGDAVKCACCTRGGAQTTSPVILALDLDKDGQISAAELKNATQSLSALDSDSDGVISREEMHAANKFTSANARESTNKSARQLGVTKRSYVRQMLLMYDKNKNRKLEIEEMPDPMLAILERIDADGDQVMTELELLNMISTIRNGKKNKNTKARPAVVRPAKTGQGVKSSK